MDLNGTIIQCQNGLESNCDDRLTQDSQEIESHYLMKFNDITREPPIWRGGLVPLHIPNPAKRMPDNLHTWCLQYVSRLFCTGI